MVTPPMGDRTVVAPTLTGGTASGTVVVAAA
jgi:hypothetical protein